MVRRSTTLLFLTALLALTACSVVNPDVERYVETRTQVQQDLNEVMMLFRQVGTAYDAAHAAKPPRITNADYTVWRNWYEKSRPEIIRINADIDGAVVREELVAVQPSIRRLKTDLTNLDRLLEVAIQRNKGVTN